MTALRLQTGERHQTSPASLRGPPTGTQSQIKYFCAFLILPTGTQHPAKNAQIAFSFCHSPPPPPPSSAQFAISFKGTDIHIPEHGNSSRSNAEMQAGLGFLLFVSPSSAKLSDCIMYLKNVSPATLHTHTESRHTHTHTYRHTHTHTYLHTQAYKYTHTHAHIHTCIHTHSIQVDKAMLHMRTHTHTHKACIHTRMCTCTHTHAGTNRRQAGRQIHLASQKLTWTARSWPKQPEPDLNRQACCKGLFF